MDILGTHVNWLGVILAAAAYYILGMIWYSPQLFGHPRWIPHHWYQRDEATNKVTAYIGEAILDLIMAYILAYILDVLRITRPLDGAMAAFWIWLGFIATTHFSPVLWDRKTIKSFLIHAGFMLIGVVLMGLILTALRTFRLGG